MTEFTISILGREEHLAKIADIKTNLGPVLEQAMKNEMVRVSDYVRSQKLSGQVLNRRSGDLSRSITGQASSSGTTVTGIVGTKGIPYAGIHEFGGSFWREMTEAFGRPIIPRSVHFTYPERSYLRTSANENAAQVSAKLQAAASAVFNAA
jgi:phage gpG-like protein